MRYWKKYPSDNKGETLFSLILSVAILAILVGSIATFEISILKNSKKSEAQSRINQQLTILLRDFTKEVRTAQISSTGSYPIAKADARELIFYTDLNNDGNSDRVRYTVNAQNTLERGTLAPTGNPLSYVPANEITRQIVTNIAGSDPIFDYFDNSYNGVTQTTPLTQPVSIQNIRVIRLHVSVDPKKPPLPFINATTTVTIRNVRDK